MSIDTHRTVSVYSAAWCEACAVYQRSRAELAKIDAAIKEVAPNSDSVYYHSKFEGVAALEALVKGGEAIIDEVLDYAERTLVDPTLKLAIDRQLLTKAAISKEEPWLFDVESLWEEVEAVYGGINGVEVAISDACEAVFKHLYWPVRRRPGTSRFEISQPSAQTVKGFLQEFSWPEFGVINLSTYVEEPKSWKPHTAGYGEFTHSTKGSLANFFTNLGVLATMARPRGFVGDGNRHPQLGAALGHGKDASFKYGTKVQLSEHVTVVLRKEKVELHLSGTGQRAIRDAIDLHAYAKESRHAEG
jgi:hypothetical protein